MGNPHTGVKLSIAPIHPWHRGWEGGDRASKAMSPGEEGLRVGAAALPSPGSALTCFTYSFYWSLPPVHTSLSLAHFPHQLELQLTVCARWALPIHTDNSAPVATFCSFQNVTLCSAAPSRPWTCSLSDSCLRVRATEIPAHGWIFGGLGMIHPPSKSSLP